MLIVKELPLVSVVVPCFNQGRYLADCISSILNQTYQVIEIIVINDGSTDETKQVADLFKDQIRYFYQLNKGASAARNAGIRYAKGKYIQFLDADDMLQSEKICFHVAYLEQHPTIDIVYGDVRYFTDKPEKLDFGYYAYNSNKPWVPELWEAKGSVLTKLMLRNILPINCALIRRSVVDDVGEWNQDLCALEDWEYWIRCAAYGKFFQFIDSLNTYSLVRWHRESTTHDQYKIDKSMFEIHLVICKYIQDPNLRTISCKRAIDFAEAMEKKDRIKRLLLLAKSTRTISASIAVLIAVGFGKNSFGMPLRNIMSRFVPWPIQKFFLRLLK